MRRRQLPWAGLLLAAGLAIAQTERLPPGAVLLEDHPVPVAGVDATVAVLKAQLDAGAIDGAIASLAAMPDAVVRERSAAHLLDRLQASGAHVPGALLDALEQMPVMVYRRHEETVADWFVPVYDIPARAQSLRRLQTQHDAVAMLQRMLRGKAPEQAIVALAAADPRVAALAIDSAAESAVMQLATANKASAVRLPSPALAALVWRTRDPADFILALEHAAPIDVLPMFGSVLPQLAPDDALRVLRDALARPDYASVAAFALVELAPRNAEAAGLLGHALATNATGASIATALAQAPDGLARIDALLANASQPASLKHLALALRLEGSTAARDRLDRLREDPRLSAAVRTELQR